MGTILASTIVAKAAEIAQDEQGTGVGGVTWTETEGLRWLNEAQIAVAAERPDASVITRSIQLAAGTRQAVAGRRLIDVLGNMGTDGNTQGRAITLVERGTKDEFEPGWRAATGTGVVKEYCYNVATPKEFDVSPPVWTTSQVWIQVTESINPAEIALISDPISIDDAYLVALQEWVLYRYFIRDAEENDGFQRAGLHFNAFFSILGRKVNADLAVNPKHREQLK